MSRQKPPSAVFSAGNNALESHAAGVVTVQLATLRRRLFNTTSAAPPFPVWTWRPQEMTSSQSTRRSASGRGRELWPKEERSKSRGSHRSKGTREASKKKRRRGKPESQKPAREMPSQAIILRIPPRYGAQEQRGEGVRHSKGAAKYPSWSARCMRKGRSGSGSGNGVEKEWCRLAKEGVVPELKKSGRKLLGAAHGEAVRYPSAAEHPRRDARGVRDISEWWWCREAGRCLAKEGVVPGLKKSGGTRLQERSRADDEATRRGPLPKRLKDSSVEAAALKNDGVNESEPCVADGTQSAGRAAQEGAGTAEQWWARDWQNRTPAGDWQDRRRSGEGGGKRGDGIYRTRKVSCTVVRAPEKAQHGIAEKKRRNGLKRGAISAESDGQRSCVIGARGGGLCCAQKGGRKTRQKGEGRGRGGAERDLQGGGERGVERKGTVEN
ncbi:hypothetical protein C8J57DRAFT_1255829 [Mycena rebaudengoi]|nr:hypothetical protein C8J57DRAFT_1255829 [Mycena rebaudengoi]